MTVVRRGRPRKGVPVVVQDVSDAQIERFFAKLEFDFEPSIKTSCQAAGISKAQYENLIAKNPAFVKRIHDFRDRQLDDMEDALFRAAQTDTNLAWKLLQTNRPDKYGQKGKLDIRHTITSAEDLKELTDEELEEMRGKLT